jgi:hypothetical protein
MLPRHAAALQGLLFFPDLLSHLEEPPQYP